MPTKVGNPVSRIQDAPDFAGPPTPGFQAFAAGVFSTRPIAANDLPLATQIANGALAAADKVKLDGTPCLIVHADGTSTAKTTIAAALAAAVAGDMIAVSPGNYSVTTNLAKNGVHWYFAAGATVTRGDDAVGFIFSDNNTAMTFGVYGFGNFTRSYNAPPTNQSFTYGVVKTQHASSDVRFEFDTVRLFVTGSGDPDIGEGSQTPFAIGCMGGSLSVRGRKLRIDAVNTTGTGIGQIVGLWWRNGEMNCEVDEIVGDPLDASNPDISDRWPIWSNVTAAPTGDMRVRSQRIAAVPGRVNSFNAVVTQGGNQALAAAWVEAPTIEGNVWTDDISKLYVTTQKLIGDVYNATGKLWLKADKIGGTFGKLFPMMSLNGSSWIDVQQFEPAGSTEEVVRVTGGTHFLSALDITAMTGQPAVKTAGGGTLNLLQGKITSDVGQYDLQQAGGTLNVSINVVYNVAKTSGTINRVPDLSGTYVAATRTISTAGLLSGGGDLSADRTITSSIATNNLVGRSTAGAGVFEAIPLSGNLRLTGGVLDLAANVAVNQLSFASLVGASDFDVDVSGNANAATLSITNTVRSLAFTSTAASSILGSGTLALTSGGVTVSSSATPTYLQSFTTYPTTAARNDFTGNVGLVFTTTKAISITRLGRLFVAGNTNDHVVSIWDTTDSTRKAFVTVTAASASDAHGFKFATLAATFLPVTGRNYVLASNEDSGGDVWRDQWDVSTALNTAYLTPLGKAYTTAHDAYPSFQTLDASMYSTAAMEFADVSTPPYVMDFEGATQFGGTDCRMYRSAGRFVIEYNDGGTKRYKYLDMTGTGNTWTYSATAP